VALGRAIVREPKAFLLDEPLSNLDPLLRVRTRAELALLHRRLGATMVYVTHDQEEALTLGSRIAVMRSGRLEQVDAPLAIFHRPANPFVASFVGSPAMNLWRATVSRDDGSLRVAPAFCIRGPGQQPGLSDREVVVIGVRPHDVDLTDPATADGRGRVAVVEPLGAATLVHVQMDDAPDDLVRVIVSADTPIAVDDRVGLRVRRDRLQLFDGGTGRRLTSPRD
jgi:ABC-type sugar transport system ATPase subunit